MNKKSTKFLISITAFIFIFFSVVLLTLFIERNSRPVIFCSSLDDSIRPRNYCVMNPFRNKQPEKMAEEVLLQLKNGNTEAIIPYLNDVTEDRKNHVLESEKELQIKTWRIGDREDSEDKISIMYWVSRQNYSYDVYGNDHLEAVSFYFNREENEWKIKQFNAGY